MPTSACAEGIMDAIGRTALMAFVNVIIVISANIKCPRCLESLPTFKRSPNGFWQTSGYCIICGRDSRKVWPFQYARHPEVWDGQYHDEGGGPQVEDAISDWWRYIRGKAAIKRFNKSKLRK